MNNYLKELKEFLQSKEIIDNEERYTLIENIKKDLIDIYLKRDYTYESFSGPREAVFFLNHHTPEVVFVDCKIHTMKALTFMEIVRTGAGNENVPFVLVGTEEELEEFNLDYLPEYVIGKLKRPVARKELMEFITKVTSKKEEE